MKRLLGLTISVLLAVTPAVAMAQQATSMPQQSGGLAAGQTDPIKGDQVWYSGFLWTVAAVAGVGVLVLTLVRSNGNGGTTTTTVTTM
jgi:hypothetical protein